MQEEIRQKDAMQTHLEGAIPLQIVQLEAQAERFRRDAEGFREAGKRVALQSHDITMGECVGVCVGVWVGVWVGGGGYTIYPHPL